MSTNEVISKKEEITDNFSNSLPYYDKNALHQREVARRLSKALEPWRDIIPQGTILEIGAGTGFLTKHLLKMYPRRNALITDLSPEIINFCKEKSHNQQIAMEGCVSMAEYLNALKYDDLISLGGPNNAIRFGGDSSTATPTSAAARAAPAERPSAATAVMTRFSILSSLGRGGRRFANGGRRLGARVVGVLRTDIVLDRGRLRQRLLDDAQKRQDH